MIAPVIEFLVLSAALAVVLVATARRGVAHLKSKWLLSTLMTLGWLTGIAVYAMPLTPVSRGLDAAAVMAGLVGLFAGRISYRIAQAWSLNNPDWEKTTPDNPRGARSKSIENRCKGKGNWNVYDVVCVDGVIKLSVNGKFVNGIRNASVKKGYLCLESEGAKIEFRNIYIMELPPGVTSAEQTAPVVD